MEEQRLLLGQLLLKQGLINEQQLQSALEEQGRTRRLLGRILVDRGLITERQLLSVLSLRFGIPSVELSCRQIDPVAVNTIPERIAWKYKILPLSKKEGKLTIAMADPTNVPLLDELEGISGCTVEPVIASEVDIENAIHRYYSRLSNFPEGVVRSAGDKKTITEEMPPSQVLSLLIDRAVHDKATHIHIQPFKNRISIRHRIDGLLHNQSTLPKNLQSVITSQIKTAAGMDISKKLYLQEAHFSTKVDDEEIDLRVTINPSLFGENIVIHILNRIDVSQLKIEELGFTKRIMEEFKKMLARDHGLILLTGSNHSGKTTTFYTSLATLSRTDKNVMSIEESVDSHLDLVCQMEIDEEIGLDFAKASKLILRADPDIIGIDQIIDLEAARLSIQAALKGKLVIAVVCADDPFEAIDKLISFGVKPYLISSSVIGILNQHLIRLICPTCKGKDEVPEKLIKELNLPSDKLFSRGKGCGDCGGNGYKGHTAVGEILPLTAPIKELIVKKGPSEPIRMRKDKEAMIGSLYESVLEKVLMGHTTVEELMCFCPGAEKNRKFEGR